MKIKNILRLLLFFMTILSFFTISSLAVWAENPTSLVTTRYELYDKLTSKEQMSIIEEEPSFLVKGDNEDVVLVYKIQESQILSQEKSNTVNSTTKINNKNNFPKMNSNGNNIFLTKFGYIFIIVIVLSILYKIRQNRIVLFIVIIVGSLNSYVNVSEAIQYGLPNKSVEKIPKGSVYNKDPLIEGYVYIGYLHKSNNNNILPSPVSEGEVIIHYKDDEGNFLAEDTLMKGEVGETYVVEEKQFDGYELQETVGSREGVYSKEPGEVTFVYRKNTPVSEGEVIIHYEDDEGNEIAANDIIKGEIGTSYNVEHKQIENYQFKFVVGTTEGVFKEYVEEITFIYQSLGTATLKLEMGPQAQIGSTWFLYNVDKPGSYDEFRTDKILFKGEEAVNGQILDIYTGTIGDKIEINDNNYLDDLTLYLTKVSTGEQYILTARELSQTAYISIIFPTDYYQKGNVDGVLMFNYFK